MGSSALWSLPTTVRCCVQALQGAWARGDHNATCPQDCQTPLLPVGFVLKIVIRTSWGCPFYVGLSGLEVHDAATGLVALSADRICAEPYSSVAELPAMASDARTVDKLVRLRCCSSCGSVAVIV